MVRQRWSRWVAADETFNSLLSDLSAFVKLRLDYIKGLKTDSLPRQKEESDYERILSELEKCGSASTKELMAKSGYSRQTIINHVKKMVKTGFLEPIEPKNSPKQRYRLVRK